MPHSTRTSRRLRPTRPTTDPATPAARPKPTHGGRRTGAGAPKGNLNTLRKGTRSARLHHALGILGADRQARALLRKLVDLVEAAHPDPPPRRRRPPTLPLDQALEQQTIKT